MFFPNQPCFENEPDFEDDRNGSNCDKRPLPGSDPGWCGGGAEEDLEEHCPEGEYEHEDHRQHEEPDGFAFCADVEGDDNECNARDELVECTEERPQQHSPAPGIGERP